MDNDTPIHRALEKYKSQQRLATALGVTQPAINRAKRRVEEGKPLSPRLSILIARDLGISINEMWPAPEVQP